MTDAPQVFVVDDDADHLAALCDLTDAAGYRVSQFATAAAALEAAIAAPPDAILSDLRMPGMDGMALLQAVQARGLDVPIVLITGHGDVSHAVRAIQAGAEDFLEKPYDSHHLLSVLARALRARDTRRELARLRALIGAAEHPRLLGESTALTALRDRVAQIGPLPVDIVVTGETGTGKEVVARALHDAGPRGKGPLQMVNCAALPEALFEIEMFGHAAGAFPGATTERIGRIEASSGGTLVLDEVESMPMALQAKLLRVLDERRVQRLGETLDRPLDLRVIAISKTDLREASHLGRFRADLFYRLAGIEITTPPLRQTGGDIVLLYSHFLTTAAQRSGRPVPEVSFDLRRDLLRRPWPGNVRELRSLAEAHALGLDRVSVARKDSTAPLAEGSLAERVAAFEAREIAAVLDRCGANSLRASQILQIPRRTLAEKIRRYGLRP
ncbi:sigma-54-dependent transcriptional regulator [Gemmobacter denitrificans]|uniref:Sigma-54 dependent transcriptional regulator n=1 Tax=Gemmobacter denitrificans TaxID=3123040 RepID=A0ABU8BSI4_9RHOB